MAQVRQTSFHGGEIAPGLYGRTDLPKRAFSLRTARNFILTPTGTAANRPGFRYCLPAQAEGTAVRLHDFTFSTSQAYVLEFGHQYIRVLQNGAVVTTVTGTVPYAAADLWTLSFTQAGDVLTVTALGYAPQEVKRVSHASWNITPYSTAHAMPAPATPTLRYGVAAGDATHLVKDWQWVCTAISSIDGEESLPSGVLAATTACYPDKPITVQVAYQPNVAMFCWYRGRDGVWGFVGTSKTLYFTDEGQVPNLDEQPPTGSSPFANNQNPAVAAYFQQRLAFANLPGAPQQVLLSKTGALHNFDFSLPQKADDSIDFTIASRQYEEVRALVALRDLLILTANSEHAVNGAGNEALSPTNVSINPISANGCARLQPLVLNNTILFVQAQQAAVRALEYDGLRGGWGGADVSLPAAHLLSASARTVVDWCYARTPFSQAWMVRDDGKLLSLTFSKENDTAAWAWHDTDGVFESVCSVPEGSEDVVYAVARRTVNGATRRYIERLATRTVLDAKLGVFLDCSLTIDQAASVSVSGLTHLANKTVYALADGVVRGPFTVSVAGGITLPVAAAHVIVGLPYLSDLELLDIHTQASANAVQALEVSANEKLVSRVLFEVDRAATLTAGESFSALRPWTMPLGYQMPVEGIINDTFLVSIDSAWNRGGRACLRQSAPLPVTVLAATRDVEIGGT